MAIKSTLSLKQEVRMRQTDCVCACVCVCVRVCACVSACGVCICLCICLLVFLSTRLLLCLSLYLLSLIKPSWRVCTACNSELMNTHWIKRTIWKKNSESTKENLDVLTTLLVIHNSQFPLSSKRFFYRNKLTIFTEINILGEGVQLCIRNKERVLTDRQ